MNHNSTTPSRIRANTSPAQRRVRAARKSKFLSVVVQLFDAAASLLPEEGHPQRLGSIPGLNIRRQDQPPKNPPESVDPEMAFASVDFLVRIVTPLVTVLVLLMLGRSLIAALG